MYCLTYCGLAQVKKVLGKRWMKTEEMKLDQNMCMIIDI